MSPTKRSGGIVNTITPGAHALLTLEELFVKKLLTCLLVALCGIAFLSACSQEPPAPVPQKVVEQPQPAAPAKVAAEEAAAPGKSGTVVETMDALNYTYLQVDTGSETFWVATTKMPVKVGDTVLVPDGTLMTNFPSKELDRTFDSILFVSAVMVGGASAEAAPGGMPAGHPPMTGGSTKVGKTEVDLTGITPAAEGLTVADVFAQQEELSGKTIKIRAKVVKYSTQIMKKNWLHIQDGTGAEGSNDLTVTTTAEAAVGDTVLVTGTLSTAVDFGSGYYYDLIIQDAEIVKE